jgi:hypothetical protein
MDKGCYLNKPFAQSNQLPSASPIVLSPADAATMISFGKVLLRQVHTRIERNPDYHIPGSQPA